MTYLDWKRRATSRVLVKLRSTQHAITGEASLTTCIAVQNHGRCDTMLHILRSSASRSQAPIPPCLMRILAIMLNLVTGLSWMLLEMRSCGNCG
jgi:hypothetical protein